MKILGLFFALIAIGIVGMGHEMVHTLISGIFLIIGLFLMKKFK